MPATQPRRDDGAPAADSSPRASLADVATESGATAALREPLFRALWVAALASNVGTWMQNTAAAWLMTDLTTSSTPVALVQTATYLPMFLIGLLAGALADIADRRRLLLVTQGGMAAAAAALGILTLAGGVTPAILLAFTFAIGLGTALMLPAWQAIIPETVSGRAVPSAVALNAASINVARATGPALGGVIVAVAQSGWVFVLNALSFIGLMIVLLRWRAEREESDLRERVLSAVRAGGRYVRHAPTLRAVLVRTGLFTLFASAAWALLPLVARREGLGSAGYGGLLACLGLGAVAGAVILTRLRERLSMDALITLSAVVFGGVSIALAYLDELSLLAALLVVGGFAWITALASLTTITTTVAPAWVRARALAAYLLVFQGAMAVGSAAWGALAESQGHQLALVAASAGFVLAVPAGLRWRIDSSRGVDLTPTPRPGLDLEWDPDMDQGPVLVIVDYRIEPERADEFERALRELGRIRRRDGATSWGIFRDPTDHRRYLETFVVESWAEYLRQRERLTASDVAAQERVRGLHVGEGPPRVSRFVGPGTARTARPPRRRRPMPLL
jgi:MFS family permease